ncbi:MAG: GNAT family N-acetyltransferase [Candidatus Staskawiczbacteria bacterium]|nr:GNAT family N-acetyltransferase [Candidatus Staskawiczbacteria bacterium]
MDDKFKQIKIKRAQKNDLKKIAEIASDCFSGLKNKKDAIKWIKCNFNAFPRMQYFVAKNQKEIAGYVLWMEKGGFRKESVFELEQIAIKKTFQGQGIGTQLVEKSLLEIKNYLKKRKSVLKLVEVTTGSENLAQNLYKKALGAKPECVVKNLFRGDEIIMIARYGK